VNLAARIIISEPARVDLVTLGEGYAEISPALADRILHRLRQKIDRLEHFPELGRARPEFGLPGLRSVATKPHVIFYPIPEAGSIIVHRVVDGRRDLAAMFSSEPF
jgi:plasmid stabilization system protein ParE